MIEVVPSPEATPRRSSEGGWSGPDARRCWCHSASTKAAGHCRQLDADEVANLGAESNRLIIDRDITNHKTFCSRYLVHGTNAPAFDAPDVESSMT